MLPRRQYSQKCNFSDTAQYIDCICLRRRSGQSCGGFALVLALSLLAFVLLLLLSMTTMVRVETVASGQAMKQTIARQNAILGMTVALGELQKYSGPDQRATARADVLAVGDADGTRYWTGVWGNSGDPMGDLSTSPVHLQWLVSGNEGEGLNPNSSNPAGPSGTGTFTPDLQVDGLSGNSTIQSAVRINNAEAALLVGPGSAGDSNAPEQRFVVAPVW